MRSFGRSTLVVATVALAATATAIAGGPTKTAPKTYTVASTTVPGVITDIVLGNGASVTVTATGSVCPGANLGCFGPNGYAWWNTTSSSFGGFVLPGEPAWGLVGRVGSGPWVRVGSGPTPLSGTGAVQFAVNDDWFLDNSGSFTVTVSYSCWPGWGYGDKNHDHCGPPGLASAPGLSEASKGPNEHASSNAVAAVAKDRGPKGR